jgi:hypothetical protein
MEQEFAQFESGWAAKVNSSNLFAQLYSKSRFTSTAQEGGVSRLVAGVRFPQWSTKVTRGIGSNPVVLRAVERILPHLESATFVGLVPEHTSKVQTFVRERLSRVVPPDCEGWDVTPWGFLSWHEVEEFCAKEKLVNTMQVLEFNREQVY